MTRSGAVVLIVLLLAAVAWAKSDHSYPMDIPVASERTINFNVQEGEFVLRGDPSAKSVHIEVSIDRFFLFRLGEQDILKRLIKVTHNTPGSVTVSTDIPRSLANWGRAEYPIDFSVVVPSSMNIRLQDTSGMIEMSDLGGDVNIDDSTGTIAVSRLSGNLHIIKQSGDVRVADVTGETRINNRSGQMNFERLGKLTVEASEGNLVITGVDSADVHNGSGNIRVTGTRGVLTLHDTSGEIIVNNVQGPVDITDTSGQIRVRNAGAVTIRDTDGNITVESAAGLKVTQKESGEVLVRKVGGQIDVPANIKLKRRG